MFTIPEAQQRLLPEMYPLLQSRYRILQAVQLMQPIGRRTLADSLKMTEREIRKETDILREQGLLDSQKSGMVCTDDGEEVIEKLRAIVYEWSGLTQLAKLLENHFGIQHVVVVPGDYSEDNTILTMLGKEAALQFMSTAFDEQVVAVTGGKSVASLAQFLHPLDGQKILHLLLHVEELVMKCKCKLIRLLQHLPCRWRNNTVRYFYLSI